MFISPWGGLSYWRRTTVENNCSKLCLFDTLILKSVHLCKGASYLIESMNEKSTRLRYRVFIIVHDIQQVCSIFILFICRPLLFKASFNWAEFDMKHIYKGLAPYSSSSLVVAGFKASEQQVRALKAEPHHLERQANYMIIKATITQQS